MPKKSSSKTAPDQKKVNFEQAVDELEKLVTRLESGDQKLEDALKDFERGVQLTRLCQEELKTAEQKVQQLVGKDENANLTDFEEDEA